MTRSPRWTSVIHWTATVVLAVLFGLVFVQVLELAATAEQTDVALEEAQQQSAGRAAAIELLTVEQQLLRDQLLELGEKPRVPESWIFVWANRTYQCDRTDPFDPNQPTYTCTPDR